MDKNICLYMTILVENNYPEIGEIRRKEYKAKSSDLYPKVNFGYYLSEQAAVRNPLLISFKKLPRNLLKMTFN